MFIQVLSSAWDSSHWNMNYDWKQSLTHELWIKHECGWNTSAAETWAVTAKTHHRNRSCNWNTNCDLKRVTYIQGGEDPLDALSCRSLFAKGPLIIGLFCRKRPIKIRHPMGLRHPVWVVDKIRVWLKHDL